ncbi:MAG TPA: mechanosensitive ion channel family protein [Candidatus Nanoarchaeia archaeon]|nr:mechanosensitive ion channel family protein [Candidatus Nanoarchaeia archaeon]
MFELPAILTFNKYLHSAIILVVFYLVTRFILWVIERYIMALARKTKTDIDDRLLAKMNGPLSMLILLGGIRLAMLPLQFTDEVISIMSEIIFSIMIGVVVFTVLGIIDIIADHFGKKAHAGDSKIDEQLVMLSKRFGKLIAVIAGFLFILSVWKVEVGPFLASLGIAGLAVAFALQETLGNIFGGISLILDRSVKVGDIIKIESGEIGTVFDVGLRATRIKTFDNEIIIVPNGKMANSQIQNLVLPDPSIRVTVDFGVQYGADPEFIKALAVDEVQKIKCVMPEPAPWILFKEMGDNALLFSIKFWVDDLSKKWEAHQEAMTRIYRRLYKEDIGIPFPQRTVWMHNAGKAPNSSPFEKKYAQFQNKYNVTLVKKEDQKNPEQQDTTKVQENAEKEAAKRKKE